MDCREFRNKHVPFVDDLLSAVETNAMQRHLRACARCARHDTVIRRSLLLVRNLPPIQPSHDFMQRLNERLAQLGPAARQDDVAGRPFFSALPSLGAFAALAAGIGAVAYFSIATTRYFDAAPSLRAPASIAALAQPGPFSTSPAESAPDAAPIVNAPIANAALVAAVPTGIPIWPAVLMAGQAPGRFANMELREGEQTR